MGKYGNFQPVPPSATKRTRNPSPIKINLFMSMILARNLAFSGADKTRRPPKGSQQRADGVNTRIVGRFRPRHSMSIHSARTRPASQSRGKSIDGRNPSGEAADARHALYRHRL